MSALSIKTENPRFFRTQKNAEHSTPLDTALITRVGSYCRQFRTHVGMRRRLLQSVLQRGCSKPAFRNRGAQVRGLLDRALSPPRHRADDEGCWNRVVGNTIPPSMPPEISFRQPVPRAPRTSFSSRVSSTPPFPTIDNSAVGQCGGRSRLLHLPPHPPHNVAA